MLSPSFLPSLFSIPQARRNVVVAPGRILSISSLVLVVLFLLFLGVVMPGVDAFVRQTTFVLLDLADEAAMVAAAASSGRGADGGQGESLSAVTLNDNMLWMPLVDSAKRDLVGLVVRFSGFDDSSHSPASSYRLNVANEGS